MPPQVDLRLSLHRDGASPAQNSSRRRKTPSPTSSAGSEQFAGSREEAWERLPAIIHETNNLGEAWPTLGEEERKVLLDYRVYHVEIIVEPIPGMKRAN